MARVIRNLTICCLVLFALTGRTEAQTSGQFVIKIADTVSGPPYVINHHYLAHVKVGDEWMLQDAIEFDTTCLWTSNNAFTQGGTNKNYYFFDGEEYRFLTAPTFEPLADIALSDTLPPSSYLNNPEYQYYFYKWDNGVGRGKQFYGVTEEWCNTNHPNGWDDGQCWEVYWVEYNESAAKWKLSVESYGITPNGGKFYPVSITPHTQDTTIESGGLSDLDNFEMEYQESPLTNQQVTPTITNYQYSVRPAYITYVFEGTTHNYYDAGTGLADQGEAIPESYNSASTVVPSTYSWTITGDGATYLSFDSGSNMLTSSDATPTVYYRTENTTGHKTAILTLTVTYSDGSQQTKSASILVKTSCQNPPQFSAEINNFGAVVSWTPTADSYVVSWKKMSTTTWTSVTVNNATSYTIIGLEYGGITYQYKVKATCDMREPDPKTFTTLEDPGLMVTGAIYGGGRMANVSGKTEVVVINCGSIGAVYGGNDIAGSVLDTIQANHTAGYAGSNIILGINENDPNTTYDTEYGHTTATIRIGSVYGGGNGYYAYNGSSFVAASAEYTSQEVAVGGQVRAMTQSHEVGEVVWTNTFTVDTILVFPKITSTSIIATNNYVKVDSIFGGAKNAFLTKNVDNGSSIIINGGTVFSVFGGNNWGGTQGYGKHYIEVNGTNINLAPSISNTATTGYGRNFGVRYLFGGGNKVEGSTTDIHINGGQLDNVFAGGNAADVYKAYVTVDCNLGAIPEDVNYTFGNTYTNAIISSKYTEGVVADTALYADYGWNGLSGIYNVRTLYGGNNEAEMTRVPTITLTSGSVGTVYGGGNAGDMMGLSIDNGNNGTLVINDKEVRYSTHVVMNSQAILVDYLYGGCRMSNVANSTWVELKKGRVGTVYGGCNISGDVGSTRVDPSAPNVPQTMEQQEVKGATYVVAGGHDTDDIIVYKNLFAGSNGYYNCSDDGITYNNDEYFDDPTGQYAEKDIPSHNETNVIVSTGTIVKGSVYAGGNMAPVGFQDNTGFYRGYPERIGMASVRMDDGLVQENVYGGGNMASIFGSNEVRVSGGRILLALYGGNDRAGQVAEMSNRILPPEYTYASDGKTKLLGLGGLGVKTYVSVSDSANIGTVYGGGNGAYPSGSVTYCYEDDEPVQSNTFVDININGGALNNHGGHIGTVYGGGNGVTTWDGVTVFFNVINPVNDRNHVDTIFGGNNMGQLNVVPDIRLLHGQVGTVYGGCNQGPMIATGDNTKTIGGYENIGSYVRLYDTYVASADSTHNVDAVVTEAIYGGCRMNGVTSNSLVYVEGGNFINIPIFAGSDISGHVGGTSRVVVVGGIAGNVYGGGNGNYDYDNDGHNVYLPGSEHTSANLVATSNTNINAPTCAQSGADILAGQVGATGNGNNRNVFGGGLGELTNTTGNVIVNVGVINAAATDPEPLIYGDVYGGSALGTVNTSINDTTTVNFNNGTIYGNVYGGGLGDAILNSNGYINTSEPLIEAIVYGTVQVNIGDPTQSSNFVNIYGKVFGGNNLAGSPQGNIYVDVYRTAHTSDNIYPATLPSPLTNDFFEVDTRYALNSVYGGGNLAHYTPLNTTDTTAYVHIHYCDNTIKYVYGGGNAANVPASKVTIDGGLMKYVFGGGNGEGEGNPGANIMSNDTLALYGGIMGYVFGGSNTKGMVYGITDLQFIDPYSCDTLIVNELYGGGNQAADDNGIALNVPCGTQGVKTIYGGSRNANVGTSTEPADIVLNVRGCDHLDQVYGGNNIGGTIFGNVTLNLYGGTIDEAFGGNNAGGDIKGTIQVNVLDMEDEDCPLHVDNVYGGGNMAAYTPTNASALVPEVNIKHGTVNNAVYGGGKGSAATVAANPKVTIGDNSVATYKAIVGATLNNNSGPGLGNVYGGGDAAVVSGSTTVIYLDTCSLSHVNRLFGGGNQASINDGGTTTVNMTAGKVVTGIYGGCNQTGKVTGDISVNVTGGTVGASGTGNEANIHGGGYGSPTETDGNVTVIIGGESTPINIYGNVYGGSAFGKVNSDNVDVTKVWLKSGTVNGRVFGGGLGQRAEGENPAIAAEVKGGVQVLVEGGSVTTAVYGCNDQYGAPLDTVNVTIKGGTVANVLGGGNLAAYTAPTGNDNYPLVYIKGGTVQDKVLGGGNAADITGNPIVTVSNGIIGTDSDGEGIGVYGGCNMSGTVTGNTTVLLTGGTVGDENIKAYIFGGGYGEETNVTGNVIVNFGTIGTENEYPMLYGELYGGSALGNVNTNASNTTTVNILNGTITSYHTIIGGNDTILNGAVFGGGLGRKAATGVAAIEAKVYGVVHVNIGAPRESTSSDPFGTATLINCDVYGCNNQYGSPQSEVHVDVYQTAHLANNEVNNTVDGDDYAIHQVFGGGNEANYEINNQKTQVYIHYCGNTIERMFGGGNAANVWGVDLWFDGGRFGEIFGGGNGEVLPASITGGGITVHKGGGYIGSYFDGSNMQGTTVGGVSSSAYDGGCGPMITTDYYLGGNQNNIIGDLNLTISCADGSTWKYVNFYGGCRLAQVYGNINVIIEGGTFENVFGGSRGSNNVAASIHDYTPEYLSAHPELHEGDGGNVTLTIKGGTIGNVFGGCNINGNIEGKITIIVEADEENCPLFIGNIYGGGNKTSYEPTYSQYNPSNSNALQTPEIRIIKATVGGHSDILPIINTGGGTDYEGNVFGGGNQGMVNSHPKVVIGDKDHPENLIRIKGSVYGGGNEGNVTGSPEVIIAPTE